MTGTESDARQIDSERVDDGYRRWPLVVLILLIGAVVGGLAGGAYGASRPSMHQADTALQVQPDPTVDITSQNSNQNSTPTLDATAYIQSQLVVINGQQLATRVREAVGLAADPDITATQVGQTYVVSIVATARTQKTAVAIAQQTGAQYIAIRTTQLRTEVNGLLTSTNQQLAGVATSLTNTQRGRSTTSALTPSQTALQTEYERLLSVRSSLNAVIEQTGRVVTVVTPAGPDDDALSPTLKDALGGAVLGALLALVLFFAVRRSRHRVRSLADLAALDVPIVLPVQPRPTVAQLRRRDARASTEARVLAARLVAEAGTERSPLCFVGTATSAGTTTVATSVAAALAADGPVLLVQAGGRESPADAWATAETETPAHARATGVVRSSIPGVWLPSDSGTSADRLPARRVVEVLDEARLLGWQVVVDAGPVSDSDVAHRCARAGAGVVLVVDRGRSTPSAVLSATELFEAAGAALIGAVLNDPPGRMGRRMQSDRVEAVSRPAGRHAGHRSSDAHAADDGPEAPQDEQPTETLQLLTDDDDEDEQSSSDFGLPYRYVP